MMWLVKMVCVLVEVVLAGRNDHTDQEEPAL